MVLIFFFNDTATTEIYTLSLHDALPICGHRELLDEVQRSPGGDPAGRDLLLDSPGVRLDPVRPVDQSPVGRTRATRSEEHTSELQSRQYLVCRLLLEKK